MESSMGTCLKKGISLVPWLSVANRSLLYPSWSKKLKLLFAVFKLLLYIFYCHWFKNLSYPIPEQIQFMTPVFIRLDWIHGRAYGKICHLDICQLSPCACAKESDFCLLKTYEPERSTLISCLMWHSVCNYQASRCSWIFVFNLYSHFCFPPECSVVYVLETQSKTLF